MATDGGLRLSSAATVSSKKIIKRGGVIKTKSSAKQNFQAEAGIRGREWQ